MYSVAIQLAKQSLMCTLSKALAKALAKSRNITKRDNLTPSDFHAKYWCHYRHLDMAFSSLKRIIINYYESFITNVLLKFYFKTNELISVPKSEPVVELTGMPALLRE